MLKQVGGTSTLGGGSRGTSTPCFVGGIMIKNVHSENALVRFQRSMTEKMPSTEDAAAQAGPTTPQDAAAPQELAALG